MYGFVLSVFLIGINSITEIIITYVFKLIIGRHILRLSVSMR